METQKQKQSPPARDRESRSLEPAVRTAAGTHHRYSTFEAHRAHVEVEGRRSELDDLRALYEPPDGRTRAEHAGYLNGVSQEARDAYERGATLYGDVLVIPRENVGKPTGADQVRVGSYASVVRDFTPLVGEERAKEVAAEFVELGRAIAGRTADGDTRLVVFQTFYNEIRVDPATGRFRPREEQVRQVESVMERMRVLAAAMRAEEWTRERAESVEFGEWERGREAGQRDAEHESHGRLTYRIESVPGLELELDGPEGLARADAEDEREEIGGRVSHVEYERVRLDQLPPRLPPGLPEEDERLLRYEIVPGLDRRLDGGARPRDILAWLSNLQSANEARTRDEAVAAILARRAGGPAGRERPLTRADELRALLYLKILTEEVGRTAAARPGTSAKVRQDAARLAVGEELTRLRPTEREWAEAIESAGTRLAQVYRAERSRLAAFEAAEVERDRLTAEALRYETSVREGAEFQVLLREAREQEREHFVSERNALSLGNDAGLLEQSGRENHRGNSNYPDLAGETPALSPYARLRSEHEEERVRSRAAIIGMLVSPDIEQERNINLTEIERHRRYFRRLTGLELETAGEANALVRPELGRMRDVILRLHNDRTQIKIETKRTNEKMVAPMFVGLQGNSSTLLPVASANEYNALIKLVRQLDLDIRVFDSSHGREITGLSRERSALYDFARDYVSYRLGDDVTRLRNEKRLFREYGARLDRARSADELRESINDIRRDNYARAARPEQFAEEAHHAAQRGEQPRRPLSPGEMLQLLLAPAPEHYTVEMRELRMSRAVTGRDRQEHVRSLERGTREPSFELQRLLAEFGRTGHDSPARHSRNIKAFLGDYLNPPDPHRNRFSPENLYELGKRLRPAERDYLFNVIDSTKRDLERREAFSRMRGQMEARVAEYLTDVVRVRGVESLEQEAAHHTDSVNRLINETLQEHGYDLAAFDLNEDHLNQITGRLVEELPRAIRAVGHEHEQTRAHEHQLSHIGRRDALMTNHTVEHSPALHAQASNDRDNLLSRQQGSPRHLLQMDDEFVEQKVSRTIGQIEVQAFAGTSTQTKFEHHQSQHKAAHELDTDYREQHVPHHVLIR